MEQDAFYEITRRSIPLSRTIHTNISWRDSVVSVLTDKGMNFFDFTYNLECLDKGIDILEFSIPSPKNSPAVSLCKNKLLFNEMKNYDYTEMIVDSSFWPHNSSLTQEMTNVNMTALSPPNFVENRSVYALLNNIGGVEMIIQQQGHQWKTVLDLSQYMQNYLDYDRNPKTFEELKKSVYIVETCSIIWAPQLNSDHSCYFVTAQKDDTILFWQIFDNDQPPLIKGKVPSCMSEIINMLWVPRTESTFWLICADILGQVSLFAIQIENGDFSHLSTWILWEYKDKMIASHLQYMIISEKVVFFCSKHRHFLVQMLDDECMLISQYIKNINDYRITDIVSSLSGYYFSTINAKIFTFKISVSGQTVNVEIIPVELKETYNTHELYSICFSNSNTLCAFGMIDRKVVCRKQILKIEVIFLSTESRLNSIMPPLLNNPSKMMTNYWDCIEALRYHINKTKKMPPIDCNALYLEGSNDIYKLKIYMILLHFYLNVLKMARISSDETMPELSVDVVKEKILFLHAQSILNTLNKKKDYDNLKMLEIESFFGCVRYVEYYSKMYKTEIKMDKSILTFVKSSKFEYECQSCDSMITEGFACSSGHLNMYCTLSFTPISGDDYLICKCCNCTARTDLCIDNPLCVFCDLRLTLPI